MRRASLRGSDLASEQYQNHHAHTRGHCDGNVREPRDEPPRRIVKRVNCGSALNPMPESVCPGFTSVNEVSLDTSLSPCMYLSCGDVRRFPSFVTMMTLPKPSSSCWRRLYRPRFALITPSFAPVTVLNVTRTFRISKRVLSSKTNTVSANISPRCTPLSVSREWVLKSTCSALSASVAFAATGGALPFFLQPTTPTIP